MSATAHDGVCMMCSGIGDQWETERRFEQGKWWSVFWVYCKACDCWTEHPKDEEPRP